MSDKIIDCPKCGQVHSFILCLYEDEQGNVYEYRRCNRCGLTTASRYIFNAFDEDGINEYYAHKFESGDGE